MATIFENTLSFAKEQDAKDELKHFRQQFFLPQKNGKEQIYFCGNSLGLQPKTVRESVEQELDDWKNFAVEGHLKAKNPWFSYHHLFSEKIAKLTGAKSEEVVVMNSLTTNLHLMMVSFYRPSEKRTKILIENPIFPSDYYAIESQIKLHGLNPKEVLLEIYPRENELTIHIEDILDLIERNKNELALIILSGVNYLTGQLLDMKRITAKGKEAEAVVGLDLAHAIGNVPLKLHEWNVDFAVWCSYKYLNSGPGGPAGIFVHEKHNNNSNLLRLAGWWGNDEQLRFKMQKQFVPMNGAAAWQLSNAQILSMAAHKASLEIMNEAGIENLRKKSLLLTGYLEFLIEKLSVKTKSYNEIKIITPKNSNERGAQLSLIIKENGKSIFEKLIQLGVMLDWREPNVMRLAPAPLYNSFEDVFLFGQILEKVMKE